MVLKLYLNNEAYPLDGLSNWFVTHSYGGSNTMQFDISTHHPHYKKIVEEAVVEYDKTLYLIKQINERTASGTATVNCEIDLDGLKSKVYPEFNVDSDTFDHIAYEILSGTGWTIVNPELVTNRRSMELKDVTPLDILNHCTNSTMFDIVYDFDNINKTITIIKPTLEPTSDVYFTDELNLTNVAYKASSTALVTRLYAYGKDGLTIAEVNGGKEYVDNFDYCNKIVCAVWRDDRYTKAQSLKDAAIEKLRVLSQPERSYTCKIVDLAKINPDYSFLKIGLYKMVTLIDREHKTKTLNQIVEYKDYPNEFERNEATLSTVSAKITTKLTTLNRLVNEINVENIIDRQKINIIARDAEANSARIAEIYTEGDSDCILTTLINQTATELRSEVVQKIGKDELSTQLIQNAEYIQMAWNAVSEVIQFINATLCIYDSAGSDKTLLLKLFSNGLDIYDKNGDLLMELNRKGENFYYDGTYLGKIGTNKWSGHDNIRGLTIDLEYNDRYSSYISLAAQDENGEDYGTFLTYFNKDTYIDGASLNKGLHLGATLYSNGNYFYFADRCYTKSYDNQGGICIESGSLAVTSEGYDSDETIIEFSSGGVDVWKRLEMNGYPIYNADIQGDSDARLKENIEDTAVNGLDVVSRLKLRQFDWIEDGTHQDIGFIAQEVNDVNPSFMGTKEDGYHTVKTIEMIPYLVKAAQELSAQVDEQQKTINKLSAALGEKITTTKSGAVKSNTFAGENRKLKTKLLTPLDVKKIKRK